MSDIAASTTHPHEPGIPPAFDAEGRCLVCGLLGERDTARALARTLVIGGGPYSLGRYTDRIVHADPCDCDLDEENAGERCMAGSEWSYAVFHGGGSFAPEPVVLLPRTPPEPADEEGTPYDLTQLVAGLGERTTVRHWLVMNDDHGGSMFSISDREQLPRDAEATARSWLRPGYHIEVQDQTWFSGPATWTTVRCDKDVPT